MAASLRDIADWFEDGKTQQAAFMIVVCDTFDHDDYPVYTQHNDFWAKYDSFDGKNMQRVMEVYDFSKPWATQANDGRAFNTPPRSTDSGIK